MKVYESVGKTVEEAIASGLAALGVSKEEVDIKIIEEGSKGLFGLFGSRQAKVSLTLKNRDAMKAEIKAIFEGALSNGAEKKPEKKEEPKPEVKPKKASKAENKAKAEENKPKKEENKSKPAKKKAEAKAEKQEKSEIKPEEKKAISAEQKDPASREGKVQGFLQELTELMGVSVSVHVHSDEEGNVRAKMEGDSQGILIGRRGETLDAIQYLTSLYLNKGEEEYIRVTIDSEGYRAKREEALVRLAKRMANRARRTGRRVSLEPMNPYERRILHSALQGEEGITTHSEGEEPNRRVVISLQKEYYLRRKEELARGEEDEKTVDNEE